MTVSRTRAARSGTRRPLFPVLHGAGIQSEPVREALATELHALTERNDALRRRIVDDSARQSRFAAHVSEHFSEGSFHLAARFRSLSRHESSSFLIVPTRRESALLSAGLSSARSAFA